MLFLNKLGVTFKEIRYLIFLEPNASHLGPHSPICPSSQPKTPLMPIFQPILSYPPISESDLQAPNIRHDPIIT